LGNGEGINVLKQVFVELEELKIGNEYHPTANCSISLKEYDLGVTDDVRFYRFLSPWMALKETNFKKYISLNPFDRIDFLNHLLRENLKTISKGVGYHIPDIEEVVAVGILKPVVVRFKNKKMKMFKGNFKVNFSIPDYFALGKQGARGFGVVVRTTRISDNQG